MFKHMKVIQDALLYNKIGCYNKGVQRSPSLSAKGCTHSSRNLHRSKYKMFRRAPKKDHFLPPLDHVAVDQCWDDRMLITPWCMM